MTLTSLYVTMNTMSRYGDHVWLPYLAAMPPADGQLIESDEEVSNKIFALCTPAGPSIGQPLE